MGCELRGGEGGVVEGVVVLYGGVRCVYERVLVDEFDWNSCDGDDVWW